jgi:hypothetical protein
MASIRGQSRRRLNPILIDPESEAKRWRSPETPWLHVAPRPAFRRRKQQQLVPNKRELAILSLPAGLADMAGYCRALDEKKIPFPAKWQQSKRWPKTHLEAWESKSGFAVG